MMKRVEERKRGRKKEREKACLREREKGNIKRMGEREKSKKRASSST
jgi:hypothetical protein